jgi:uncharacterized protein
MPRLRAMMKRIAIVFAAALLAALGGEDAAAQFTGANNFYDIPIAASHNDAPQVERMILEGNRNLDEIESQQGRTALDFTADFDNADLARFLLDHGARVDARDRLGNTALHWAAERGALKVMRVLIAAHATIDAQNHDGATPLMIAADQAKVAAVRLLLQAGADPKKQDFTGRDAFGWAASHPAVVAALNAHR